MAVQATLTLYGGELLPYYLHEETGWSLDVDELRAQTYKVGQHGTNGCATCCGEAVLLAASQAGAKGTELFLRLMQAVAWYDLQDGIGTCVVAGPTGPTDD